MANAKNNKLDDFLLKNLRGFCVKGGGSTSPGNVPTGHLLLDFAICYGEDPTKANLDKIRHPNTNEPYNPEEPLGLPLGKLVEIFGEEGGGKSSIAYRVCGYAQKMGYPVAWIDTEHSFSNNLARINGCDKDNIYYSNLINHDDPDKLIYAEDVLDGIITMCKGGMKVIVLDSVANLVPKAREEADAAQKFMGLLPRLLSDNLGKMVSNAEKSGTLLLFINQLRKKIGEMWGDPETSPGGHSLKHNASVRIKITKKNSKDANIEIIDQDTGDKKLIGRYANFQIKKSKMAKPFFETFMIPVYYEPYFPDIEQVVFDTSRQLRLITVLKGVFKWGDIKIEGREKFIEYIKSNNLVDKLIVEVKEKATEKNVILPPELSQCKNEVKEQDGMVEQVQRGRPKKDSSGSKKKS